MGRVAGLLLITGLLAGPARGAPARPGMPAPDDSRALAGRIHHLEGHRILLQEDREPLYWDHATVVLWHGRPASPAVLRPGDEVRASFDYRNGHRVARTLSVVTP